MYLPENIVKIRKKWRLNQADFGELMGVNQHTVKRFESGAQEPLLSVALKLEELSGIPLWRLVNKKIEGKELLAVPGEGYNLNAERLEEPKGEKEEKSAELLEIQKLLKHLVEEHKELKERLSRLESKYNEKLENRNPS